jgi:hypothetical protein
MDGWLLRAEAIGKSYRVLLNSVIVAREVLPAELVGVALWVM